MSDRAPAKCLHCDLNVQDHRYVWFGVVGPFCDVACREMYLEADAAVQAVTSRPKRKK